MIASLRSERIPAEASRYSPAASGPSFAFAQRNLFQ